MNLDIATLANDTVQLKAVLESYEERIAAYEKHIDILMEQIHLLRAQLYGRKSEKCQRSFKIEPFSVVKTEPLSSVF